jgi:hypothetical protein
MQDQNKSGQGDDKSTAFCRAAYSGQENPSVAHTHLGYDPRRIHCDGYLDEFEEASKPLLRKAGQPPANFECGGLSND